MTGYPIEILDVTALKPSEQVDPAAVDALVVEIGQDGVIRMPILVERTHAVILDGHHRWHAIRRLGLSRIPGIRLDYADSRLSLGSWNSRRFTREDVIRAGETGQLLPHKSTRHLLAPELVAAPVPLDSLC